MKPRQHTIAFVVSAALGVTLNPAHADEAAALSHEILTMDATAGGNSGAVTGKIVSDFQSFAGSRQNATALVVGLREGSEITLTQHGHRSATFTPATGHMGYGNISTALALAKYQLAQQGITNPTPLQLKAALNGGTIFVHGKPVSYDGVLQMRADGLGWGQIAHQLGTKLGPVVSGIKAQNTTLAPTPHGQRPLTTSIASTPSGVTTAQGRGAVSAGEGKGKGIVDAGGASASTGPGKGKGIVDASGGSGTAHGKGNAEANVSSAAGKPAQTGRGIVSAGGQTVGAGPTSVPTGQGSGAVTAAGAGAGNAGGGAGSGQGKALGHSK